MAEEHVAELPIVAIRLDPKDIAIRDNPNYTAAFLNRGSAWHDKKEFDKAIKDFDEVIRLDPKSAAAFFERGSAWCDLDRAASAKG